MRDDIRKRIQRSDPSPHRKQRKPRELKFNPDGKCVLCGRGFKSDECPHDIGQNERAYQLYNDEILFG